MNTEIEPYLLHLYFSEEDGKYHNFVNTQHYEATVSSGKWLIKSLSVETKNHSPIPSPVVETWSNRSSEVQEACERIETCGLCIMTGDPGVNVGPYIVWLLRSLNDIADSKQVRSNVQAHTPARPMPTEEQSYQILIDMADHISNFSDDTTTEHELSAECIRYILDRLNTNK